MNAEDLQRAIAVVQEISGMLKIPPPKVVVTLVGVPRYVGGVIYLPADLPSNMVERVVAHEMAHHLHDYFGVPVTEEQAEEFASTFEEVWVRMQSGFRYPVFTCPKCGFRTFAYGSRFTCPKCNTTYTFRYPSPELDKALGLAVISGIAAYFITGELRKQVRKRFGKELTPEQGAALGAGLVGFLAGLIL